MRIMYMPIHDCPLPQADNISVLTDGDDSIVCISDPSLIVDEPAIGSVVSVFIATGHTSKRFANCLYWMRDRNYEMYKSGMELMKKKLKAADWNIVDAIIMQ